MTRFCSKILEAKEDCDLSFTRQLATNDQLNNTLKRLQLHQSYQDIRHNVFQEQFSQIYNLIGSLADSKSIVDTYEHEVTAVNRKYRQLEEEFSDYKILTAP